MKGPSWGCLGKGNGCGMVHDSIQDDGAKVLVLVQL